MPTETEVDRWTDQANKCREEARNVSSRSIAAELELIAKRYDRLVIRTARKIAESEARQATEAAARER
jgi:hypothetical protein